MKPQSRYIIHIGINFVMSPSPNITPQSSLAFQQAILSNGLEFVSVTTLENQIVLSRESPTPLQITVNGLNPQVGQFLVAASQPKRSLDLFAQEAEAAVKAFLDTWPVQNRQMLKSDATIRELHETTSEHAFQELWENLLKQPSSMLKSFERPILGGGLRFVMAPLPDEQDPAQIEVKIESFLGDTSKIFVETQFNWIQPTAPGMPFNVRERLSQVNAYIEKQVESFILGGSK